MVTSAYGQALPFRHRVGLRIVRTLMQALIRSRGPASIGATADALERDELSNAQVAALVQALIQSNGAATFGAIANAFERHKLSNVQVDALVQALIRTNGAATFGAIANVFERHKLSNAQVDALIYEAFGSPRAKEVAELMLDIFREISGACLHYSQEGEDILIDRLLSPHKVGVFVDVGAHHPIRFSNTYMLYRKGWRGINVDATPGSMDMFKKLRPEDINIECAVSSVDTPMTFHMFKESALNTFDSSLAQEYVDSGQALERTVEIQPRRLSSILEEHLPTGKHIDLLSIDVEGKELEVLRSNDWDSYCPDLIVLEVLSTPFASLQFHPTILFLADKDYKPVSRLANSVILHRRG